MDLKRNRLDDITLTRVQQCFQNKRYEDALMILRRALSQEKDWDWNTLYLAGQACRFLNRMKDAQQYLEAAVALSDKQAAVFLALGIVDQLQEKYEKACAIYWW
jgi:tetratricopeptide (TPR) repeat protein